MRYVTATLPAIVGALASQAVDKVAVDRCVKDGAIVFSDRPCDPNAAGVIEHDAASRQP